MAQQPPYCSDTNNFEHTNFFIRTHPDIFRIHHYLAPKKYSRTDIVLALDTPLDLEVLRKIYSKLYPKNRFFDIDDIFKLLKKEPDILKPLESLNIDRVGIK
jgi:spore coat polysaccharide biosynthesis protein SpsF